MKTPHAVEIVVLDAATMRGEMLRPDFPHRWHTYPLTAPAETATRIRNAHIVITNKAPLCKDDINAAKNLKLIAVAATGMDNVDLQAAADAGVQVRNVREYANNSVAEHVLALVFALARGVVLYHAKVREGAWSKSPIFSPDWGRICDVRGRQIGIIGAGALGQAVAEHAAAVGLRPMFLLRDKKDSLPRLPLPKLLADSDIISLHCPLTPQTHQLINQETLAMMKPGAFLINTARGGLVQSAALVAALQSEHLGGAAIDVLPVEPPPADDILLNCRHPNLIITPHVAWAGEQSLAIFHRKLVQNLNLQTLEESNP